MTVSNSRRASILLLAALVAAAGCDQSPTSPDGEIEQMTVPQMSSHAGNGVVLSASGSGHIQGPTLGGAEVGWRTFTFNAKQSRDGSVRGNLQYNTHDQGDPAVTHKQKGRIFCMTRVADSDIVLIGAEGTRRTPDDNPTNPIDLPQSDRPHGNHGMFFAVRDNGEGATASGPDEFTAIVHTLMQVVTAVCADPEILGKGFGGAPAWAVAQSFFNDVEAGNIQVK